MSSPADTSPIPQSETSHAATRRKYFVPLPQGWLDGMDSVTIWICQGAFHERHYTLLAKNDQDCVQMWLAAHLKKLKPAVPFSKHLDVCDRASALNLLRSSFLTSFVLQQVKWFFFPYHKDNQDSVRLGIAFRNRNQLIPMLHKEKYMNALNAVSQEHGFKELPAAGTQPYIMLTQPAAKRVFDMLEAEEQEKLENLKALWNRVGRDLHAIVAP